MWMPCFRLLVLCFLVSSSGVSAANDDASWPWTHTKYLSPSNWTSLLTPSQNSSQQAHPVWFIFHYLNYCGRCKKAEPGWEATANYARNWSKYIQIGAYDCASESTSGNVTCQDEKYPQWRIYCPVTNSSQLAFDSQRLAHNTTAEEILMWSLEKLNTIAPQCYGPAWPVREIIAPKTIDDLNGTIRSDINRFQLFVSDDVLLYHLYVFNHSDTVATEPIYHLAKANNITQGVGIWRGIRNESGQLSLESIDAKDAMQPLVLHQNIVASTEAPEEENTATMKPTHSDIDSAVVWMVTNDLRRKLPKLTEDVKIWLNVLHTYYPGSNTVKHFLHGLVAFMKTRAAISATEYQSYINFTSVFKLPGLKFDHCKGSDATKRGYPCALWVLFHSMTVKRVSLAEKSQLPPTSKPYDLIVSIRDFVGKFFLCEECAMDFMNMTINAESEVNSTEESVLYLWRGHNLVNERLRYDNITNDPAWPKVPFPTKQQCNSCVRNVDQHGDATEYDENEVYKYFRNFYTPNNAATAQSYARLSFVCFSLLLVFVQLYN